MKLTIQSAAGVPAGQVHPGARYGDAVLVHAEAVVLVALRQAVAAVRQAPGRQPVSQNPVPSLLLALA